MRFQYHEVATLPPLAWCAHVSRGNDAVAVFHGSLVETQSRGFVEGMWNGTFASLDFTDATVVVATGALAHPHHLQFSTSTDHLSPLFSIAKGDSVYVSNSPTFVLSMSGEEPDPVYPFYPYDFVRIYRQGLFCPDGRLRLRSASKLGVHCMTLITIDERCRVSFQRHRLCEPPHDFQSYKALLLDAMKKIFDNGADPARKRRHTALVPLSKGYDSTASAVLAKSAGGADAFTYEDNRVADPKRDSGASNARFFLKMDCKTYSRWQYLSLDRCAEAEFCYVVADCKIPLAAAEEQLSGRILILGESGDTIWHPPSILMGNEMSKTWAKFTLGISPIEFRLRVGYHAMAPASIAARHHLAIHAIATSDEMRPWSVGGDYDRPLPRRIAEEGGLPRDRFGVRKAASSHSHLTEPDRFSPKGLSDYRQFVDKLHAGLPSRRVAYWRARARWLHNFWDRRQGNIARYVRSTFLQRHFPYVFNARPRRVPWDYMFTFQWTVASMRNRYAMPDRHDPGVERSN